MKTFAILFSLPNLESQRGEPLKWEALSIGIHLLFRRCIHAGIIRAVASGNNWGIDPRGDARPLADDGGSFTDPVYLSSGAGAGIDPFGSGLYLDRRGRRGVCNLAEDTRRAC